MSIVQCPVRTLKIAARLTFLWSSSSEDLLRFTLGHTDFAVAEFLVVVKRLLSLLEVHMSSASSLLVYISEVYQIYQFSIN